MYNSLQNAYMTTCFVSFDAKSLGRGRMFVLDEDGNPNSL
jgi:hypothetical protein